MRGWPAMAGICALLAEPAMAQDGTIRLVNAFAARLSTDQPVQATGYGGAAFMRERDPP